MGNRSIFIKSLFLQGLSRDQVVERVCQKYSNIDRDVLLNHIGVILYNLRKSQKVSPRVKTDPRPSRHSIIKSLLYKDATNSEILKVLIKVYPEISEKVHKQRICEYRWFFNRGLL